MKTVIEMARDAGFATSWTEAAGEALERFAELVRADERNSWPAEMEAMERQVNILTDALNDRQRWFDAVTAQHKQAILAEREACAKVCEDISPKHEPVEYGDIRWGWKYKCPYAAAIRARGNT